MTGLLADCDHFIAGAAMIGGISYFHTYAYDLLATNERIIAVVLRRRDQGAQGRAGCRRSPTCRSSMVFESTDHWPSLRGPGARGPAAAVVLRLPEAGRRVLRPRRLGPVPAAVHDRAPVQLRRHRREPGARRRGDPVRQRQARDEPRGARPGAEGAQGPGPAAHPRRRATRSGTTPTAATWPAASSPRWSTRTRSTRTSTCPPRSRTTVLELAEVIWRKIKGPDVPLRVVQRRPVRVRRAAAGARRPRRPSGCSASRRRPRSTRCSTRSSRGSRRRSRTARSELAAWIRQADVIRPRQSGLSAAG